MTPPTKRQKMTKPTSVRRVFKPNGKRRSEEERKARNDEANTPRATTPVLEKPDVNMSSITSLSTVVPNSQPLPPPVSDPQPSPPPVSDSQPSSPPETIKPLELSMPDLVKFLERFPNDIKIQILGMLPKSTLLGVRCFARGLSQATTEMMVREIWLNISEYKDGGIYPWSRKGFAQTLKVIRVLGLHADKKDSTSPGTDETAVRAILQADFEHLESLLFSSTIQIRPCDAKVIASLIGKAQKLTHLVLPSLHATKEDGPNPLISKVGAWIEYSRLRSSLWIRPGADLQLAGTFSQKSGPIYSLCVFGHDMKSSDAMRVLRHLGLSVEKKAKPSHLTIYDLATPRLVPAFVSFVALNTLGIVDCEDSLSLLQILAESPTFKDIECMRKFTWMETKRSVKLETKQMSILITILKAFPKLEMARIYVKSLKTVLPEMPDLIAVLPPSLRHLTLLLGRYQFKVPTLRVLGARCPQLTGLGLLWIYREYALMHESLRTFNSSVSAIAPLLPSVQALFLIGPPARALVVGLMTTELMDPYQAFAAEVFEVFEGQERTTKLQLAMFGLLHSVNGIRYTSLCTTMYGKKPGSSTVEPISAPTDWENEMAISLGAAKNPSLDGCMKEYLPKDPRSL